MRTLVIAIDGPSGSGKSTTARALASRLGLAYLDTGAMYRAVADEALRRGVIDDADAVVAIARDTPPAMGLDPAAPTVGIAGRDVTTAIREPALSAQVSKVATIQAVRDVLSDQMRAIVARAGRIVAEGRDITTKVCPQADVRVLLVADPAERVRRREAELAGAADHASVTDQVVRRDRDDATMSQFETPAPGVTLIDSTHLWPDEVVARILTLVPWGAREP
ncbi:MAG: (d)CMP kinase [Actinomycetia bacterium]|nr:(d)CMP kinase [Actinomycetes bacterium]